MATQHDILREKYIHKAPSYKVGQEVTIQTRPQRWFTLTDYAQVTFMDEMLKLIGETGVITQVYHLCVYRIKFKKDGLSWNFCENWIQPSHTLADFFDTESI